MSQDTAATGSTGSDDYAASYYASHLGPPYTYDEPHWKTFFGAVADQIKATLAPTTVYDAGCAKGFLVRALAERGIDARGGDISEFAIADAPPELAPRLEVKDLTEPFDDRFDLITCVEVLEHMAPQDARVAIRNMCAAADTVLLSTTPEDFNEPTHVNVRQAAGWAQDFAAEGFFRRTDQDASYLTPWATVFSKDPAVSPAALVSRYEQLLQPLIREVIDKRNALLVARRELDDASAPVMIERDQLLEQLAERTRERDTAVHERNLLSVKVDEITGPDAQLSRLALVDELMGAKAELAQLRIKTENAVAAGSRDADQLRTMLHQANLARAAAIQEAGDARREADGWITEVKKSASWRIGQTALLPIRVARKVRRVIRRQR